VSPPRARASSAAAGQGAVAPDALARERAAEIGAGEPPVRHHQRDPAGERQPERLWVADEEEEDGGDEQEEQGAPGGEAPRGGGRPFAPFRGGRGGIDGRHGGAIMQYCTRRFFPCRE